MKNAKYKLLSALAVGAGCVLAGGFATNDTFAIGNAAFEDENFYACVVRYYDKLFDDVTVAANASDTVLTDAQLAKITKLNCGYRVDNEVYSNYGVLTPEYDNDAPRITSLAGLEKLTGLLSLYMSNQGLSTIDLSANTNLTELGLGVNELSSIDLSHNTKINHINFHSNKFTSFSHPELTQLGSLNLHDNLLESIDVSKNTKLGSLFVDANSKLKEIDISNNPSLARLYTNNRLKVNPYVDITTTDDCKLSVKIPFVGTLNTVLATNVYYLDESTKAIIFKKKPVKNQVSSGIIETLQDVMGANGVTNNQLIYLPDSVFTEYDKLSSCVPKSAEENIPVPDTSANTGGKSSIKTPDTGAMTGENNAKIIGISLLALGGVALLAYLVSYAYRRQKNHVKF